MGNNCKTSCVLILFLLVSSCQDNADSLTKVETIEIEEPSKQGSSNAIVSKSSSSNGDSERTISVQNQQSTAKFRSIEWIELMPKEDLDALLSPPDYVYEIEEGSEDDQIDAQLRNQLAANNEDRYQQALVSTSIVQEMNDKDIRIPGFVVPVAFSDQHIVTQFFLVPFFGACLHMPPPPPNQIIFVNSAQGLKLESLYQPFWISGKLSVSLTENELATSAYSMELQEYEPFSE